MKYNACDSCTAAIVNDDYSGMDEETFTSVSATVEVVGMVCEAGEFDPPGYWDCYFCNDVQIGKGHTFESIN
jgi:hypothetical protein